MSKKIGYTAGVFDLFHIGHLNVLKKAKEKCDYLIVAVSTDELVEKYKGKKPIISYNERKSIVEAIKYVDKVVPQENRNKIEAVDKYDVDIMFVGDDWKGNEVFQKVDKYMKDKNKKGVYYFPYTPGVSSTKIKDILYKVYKQGLNN